MRKATVIAGVLAATLPALRAQAETVRRAPYPTSLYPPASTSPYAQNPLGPAQSKVAPQPDGNVQRGGFLGNPAGARGGGVDDQRR